MLVLVVQGSIGRTFILCESSKMIKKYPAPKGATIEINYPPDFKPRYGYDQAPQPFITAIFEAHRKQQLELVEAILTQREKFAGISLEAGPGSLEPYWDQPWFPPLDGMSLHTLIGINNPHRYVEIGSGNSTKFARRAINDYRLSTRICSIDPNPRVEIDQITDEVIRTRLEDIDMTFFDNLTANDIVFIDGSHRCLQNSDVTAFFLDVLPRLKAGTLVGIHDIIWPLDYPEIWVKRYYNEQYILAAYMLALGEKFPLVFSSVYAGMNFGTRLDAVLDPQTRMDLKERGIGIEGVSLWFRKPSI